MPYSILLFSAVFCFIFISSIVFNFSQFCDIQIHFFVLFCFVFFYCILFYSIILYPNIMFCSFLICCFILIQFYWVFFSVINIFYSCSVFLFYSVYLQIWSFIFSCFYLFYFFLENWIVVLFRSICSILTHPALFYICHLYSTLLNPNILFFSFLIWTILFCCV